MKQLIIITILLLSLVSCTKKDELKPIDNFSKWYGIYHSDNLLNDSTGTIILDTYISISTDRATSEYNPDSIRFTPINTSNGLTYIYNVKYNNGVYQKGSINGNNGTMNDYDFNEGTILHSIKNFVIILLDNKSIKVEYDENIFDIPYKTYHYVGVYTK